MHRESYEKKNWGKTLCRGNAGKKNPENYIQRKYREKDLENSVQKKFRKKEEKDRQDGKTVAERAEISAAKEKRILMENAGELEL